MTISILLILEIYLLFFLYLFSKCWNCAWIIVSILEFSWSLIFLFCKYRISVIYFQMYVLIDFSYMLYTEIISCLLAISIWYLIAFLSILLKNQLSVFPNCFPCTNLPHINNTSFMPETSETFWCLCIACSRSLSVIRSY